MIVVKWVLMSFKSWVSEVAEGITEDLTEDQFIYLPVPGSVTSV